MKVPDTSAERIMESPIFDASDIERGGNKDYRPERLSGDALGRVSENARSIPVYHACDVLVVGGGPSGTAAAAAAAKQGANVTLLERYNHLGGLSTGGLVIWIDRMTDWSGELVIRGFANEIFSRLPPEAIAGPEPSAWGSREQDAAQYWSHRTAAFHGVVTWSPTVSPEHLKLASQEILLERGVRVVYHSLACLPYMENGKVAGAIFESKEGRMAIRAKVVIDATGDGDMFARAGAAFEDDIESGDIHHCANTAWLFGGVDMEQWINFKSTQPEAYTAFLAQGRSQIGLFDRAFVSWRNDVALFMGPRQSGFDALNVDDLSSLEVRSHRLMASHLELYRAGAPGFANAYLLYSAPQLGVRHTRRLKGVGKVLRSQWPDGVALPDEIGITPSVNPKWPNISIPYACLVPQHLDGLLACGRHVSCDPNSHGFMREIPQCWITGQAAGVAAALAVNGGVEPRAVSVLELQTALLAQGAYLRPAVR
jgi:FAD dependent oxidoreductase